MPDLTALAERVRQHIPLTHHLAFNLVVFADDQLTLTAPLGPNVNDKGTMFAGSQAALMALAGWCLTTLQAERQISRADVLAMNHSLSYRRPVTGEITIMVSSPVDSLQRFQQRLARGERAVLQVEAVGHNADGEKACQYQAEYMARAV